MGHLGIGCGYLDAGVSEHCWPAHLERGQQGSTTLLLCSEMVSSGADLPTESTVA